ncbi:MAG: carboxymuconolactone decarboxylase family protein [Anaerolineae bacterium]|nr:carboxymuconolactone decarboxylase family protein [Anaerolineae bacterium]
MTTFTIHTIESAPESSRPILQKLQELVGFVPNLAATMAGAPTVLEAFASLSAINARSSFSGVERELIAMTVAREIECTYCMAAHSTFAKAQGASDSVLEAVRTGKAPGDARLAALTTFTRQVVCQHGQVSDADARAFLNAGFTQAQLLEVLIGVSQVSLVNLVHRMAGTPLDAGFQPQAWSAS